MSRSHNIYPACMFRMLKMINIGARSRGKQNENDNKTYNKNENENDNKTYDNENDNKTKTISRLSSDAGCLGRGEVTPGLR